MKITIMGTPGSGKSTLAKNLAEKLGLDFLSIGDMRREMARERNMTIHELNELGKKESWTDKEVDEYQRKYAEENDDFIIEGRMSWYFIPDSIKIFLDAEPRERAKRLTERHHEEENYESKEQALKALKERVENDKERYKKYYDVNPYDKTHYDILIDSTDTGPEELVEETIEVIKSQEANST